MALQTIIDNSESITINRRKVVGIQFTRNDVPRVSLTPTLNPWRFTVGLPTQLRYGDVRSLLESIDALDRIYNETISFGSNPNLAWLFRYQGVMTLAQRNTIVVESFEGNQLTLTNLPTVPANRALFEPNDLIQIGAYTYPFTSVTQVQRGTGSSVTVTTHRPNIIPNSVVGEHIVVGSDCQFNLFCPNMPTYRLFPGGTTYSSNGTVTGNARIEWSDNFELYEYLADLSV